MDGDAYQPLHPLWPAQLPLFYAAPPCKFGFFVETAIINMQRNHDPNQYYQFKPKQNESVFMYVHTNQVILCDCIQHLGIFTKTSSLFFFGQQKNSSL